MRRALTLVTAAALTIGVASVVPASAAEPPGVPTITSPTPNQRIDGTLTLTASAPGAESVIFTVSSNNFNGDGDGGEYVRSFDLDPAPVVDGVARVTIPSWGLYEAAVAARACSAADECSVSSDPVRTVIANTDLTLDEPSSDVWLGPNDDNRVPLSAHGDGGRLILGLREQAEGDLPDRFIPTADNNGMLDHTLTADWNGYHQLMLGRCSPVIPVCDEWRFGSWVERWLSIPVDALVNSDYVWSPNGDGHHDTPCLSPCTAPM